MTPAIESNQLRIELATQVESVIETNQLLKRGYSIESAIESRLIGDVTETAPHFACDGLVDAILNAMTLDTEEHRTNSASLRKLYQFREMQRPPQR